VAVCAQKVKERTVILAHSLVCAGEERKRLAEVENFNLFRDSIITERFSRSAEGSQDIIGGVGGKSII